VTEHRRVHFNRMHRDRNLIVGWCYAYAGETFDGFAMGPTYIVENVNARTWAIITDVAVEVRDL
jgi:hypothetical protein